MKVLIVNSLFSPNVVGGAERSLQILAEQLVDSGVNVTVASLTPGDRGVANVGNGIRTYYLPIANLYWPFGGPIRMGPSKAIWHAIDIYNPWMATSLARCVEEEHPDLVHTNNLAGFSIAAWAVARRLGLPVVHTIRDYYMMCVRSTRYGKRGVCGATCVQCRLPAFVRRGASRWVNGVVGNSHHVLTTHIEHGLFREAGFRGVVYSSAVSTRTGERGSDDRGIVRFGYLGQIERSKGLDLLIDHFARRTSAGWELVIAGKGPTGYVSGLMSRSARPQIRWVGWVEASSFLSQIDVLLVPSLWDDPLPRVILEAYQHGVPVVAAKRGGIPEVVTDEVSGLLFDPDNPGRFDHIIERLVSSPDFLSQLQRGAKEKARDFTPERTAAGYLRAYSAVLKNEGRC